MYKLEEDPIDVKDVGSTLMGTFKSAFTTSPLDYKHVNLRTLDDEPEDLISSFSICNDKKKAYGKKDAAKIGLIL